MKYAITIALAVAVLAGAGLTATSMTDAQEQATKWANVTQVCDYGCHAYENNMGVIWNEPIFKGQTGGVSSILITLDGEQVGKNKIAADGSFHKGQKTPLPDGTYDLIVRDCGPIAIEPNVGECTMPGKDLNDYAVLFEGTIRIIHEAVRQQQESGSEEPQTETQTVQETEAEEPQTETQPYGVTITNADDAPFAVGDKIHFEANAPPCMMDHLENATVSYGEITGLTLNNYRWHVQIWQASCDADRPTGWKPSAIFAEELLDNTHEAAPALHNIHKGMNITSVSADHSEIIGYITMVEEFEEWEGIEISLHAQRTFNAESSPIN